MSLWYPLEWPRPSISHFSAIIAILLKTWTLVQLSASTYWFELTTCWLCLDILSNQTQDYYSMSPSWFHNPTRAAKLRRCIQDTMQRSVFIGQTFVSTHPQHFHMGYSGSPSLSPPFFCWNSYPILDHLSYILPGELHQQLLFPFPRSLNGSG